MTLLAERYHAFLRFVLVLNEMVLALEIDACDRAITSTADE